ncbi:hypothetical protein BDV09DRAFT_175534 [Aspergillus tetrazonus]
MRTICPWANVVPFVSGDILKILGVVFYATIAFEGLNQVPCSFIYRLVSSCRLALGAT